MKVHESIGPARDAILQRGIRIAGERKPLGVRPGFFGSADETLGGDRRVTNPEEFDRRERLWRTETP
jgi:hypothetical protein